MDLSIALIVSSFVAGLVTFLAPCTLPLVPGYLGFISGVSAKKLGDDDYHKKMRKRIILNGFFYVLGFSLVFILLGSLFGLLGFSLGVSRVWLSRVGGVFVVFFGLYLMHIFKLPLFKFLDKDSHFKLFNKIKPGNPMSSFLFGMTFAFGWTPCVGPVLGTILLFASSSATVFSGAFLLLIFSIGLGIPFMLIAFSISRATLYIKKISKYLDIISIVGGIFLVFLGVMLATNSFSIWVASFYRVFQFINYDRLLDYL